MKIEIEKFRIEVKKDRIVLYRKKDDRVVILSHEEVREFSRVFETIRIYAGDAEEFERRVEQICGVFFGGGESE